MRQRPCDVERVQAIGLATYIDEQLSPERIKDDEIARRLAGFETLTMSARELAERYFIPALMERRERQRARADQAGPEPRNTRKNADSVLQCL